MDISTEIDVDNVDEVREIVSKYSSDDLLTVRIGFYLNLDTDWNKGNINSDFLFVLNSDSSHLRCTAFVSYEELKQALFDYLMEK